MKQTVKIGIVTMTQIKKYRDGLRMPFSTLTIWILNQDIIVCIHLKMGMMCQLYIKLKMNLMVLLKSLIPYMRQK
ncbi:hypothetical protein GIB67_043277, partial [Kingdonia uniflora]